ncbi:MAG: Na(+)/H(+) antiporter NhaA [Isosphaeraceae bacterium]|jgi:NhaA family Na+:H+ antiporter|nr:MAG: Na(+)/H(+) antiporter NhaA [Isosphaeraceae bacterium]
MPTTDIPPTPAEKLLTPFRRFLGAESSSGLLLIGVTALAMLWANSPFADSYFGLWHAPLAVELNGQRLEMDLSHWINDGLMVIFFLLVGLEIKREVLRGELASPRRAALPLAAALGGMILPALIYLLINAQGSASRGWGIPMATDIAFALGMLSLVGRRAPLGLRVFLAALAIVDDLGAVLVIAIFYTTSINLVALVAAGGVFLVLCLFNLLHVRRTFPYVVLGIALWLAVYQSGVHATIAGVLLAIAIPDRRRIDDEHFSRTVRSVLEVFERDQVADEPDELTARQRDAVEAIEHACESVQTPLRRIEHALLPWVSFFIMPIFALANAGVALNTGTGPIQMVQTPIALGIILGLVIGKPLGIMLLSGLAVRLGWAELPQGTTWKSILGAAILGGIGFTMALFIADLAFKSSPAALDSAKIGVLTGSIVTTVAGLAWLWGPGGRRPSAAGSNTRTPDSASVAASHEVA